MRIVFGFIFLMIASLGARADALGCNNGVGTVKRTTPGGYTVEAHLFTDASGQRMCTGYVSSPAGEKVFEMSAPSVTVELSVFGADINGDEKQDVVFRSLKDGKHVATIVTPEASPALQREIITSVPLNFEDKGGDGKIEIWAREAVFMGIDGQPHENSPQPMNIFRMKGASLMNVSPSFWPEYEREIQLIQEQYTRDDLWELNKPTSHLRQEFEKKPHELARMQQVRGLLLQVVVNHLYGGRGQEGWKLISDYWLDRDKERIRQLILATRARGLMSEVNKGVPAPSVKAGTQ